MAATHIIAKGAEATITARGDVLTKTRDKKSYRISSIDTPLRLRRTRKEVKSLEKARSIGLNVPSILGSDESSMEIVMEKIPGKKLRDVLSKQNMKKICVSLGSDIALMHNHSLIHGDLTTSNMIVNSEDGRLYLIDFGLSIVSEKAEDMAVDLHLFRRALESKHHLIWQVCWDTFLDSYLKRISKKDEVVRKLTEVMMRGRNKH